MKALFTSLVLLLTLYCTAQTKLRPVFDPREYSDLLSIAFHSSSIADSVARQTTTDPYHLEYRSPEVGLLNRWTLYLRNDNVAVIDVRGTVNQPVSWLANFYAAMIPATGSLQLNDSTRFDYQLAADAKANVHVGWTIALAHIAPDVKAKLIAYHAQKNIREVLITGHSQGGAIAFLLRSYLEYEQRKGNIPKDLFFKTYCSAAPKPGNMYYAYDYDFITRGGWSYTVVNSADWVPETPFTIQTLQSFNPTNIFVNTKKLLRKQKFAVRFIGNMLYNKLERKPRKAQRKFEKYLGKKMYRYAIRKTLPQLKQPTYMHDNNYMRAGSPVILLADGEYLQKFPDNPDQPFTHHMFAAYQYLLKKYYSSK